MLWEHQVRIMNITALFEHKVINLVGIVRFEYLIIAGALMFVCRR
jgi:hypothetical protein